jgi:hypothetical protein
VIIDAAELDAASAYKLLIGSIVPRAIAWVSTLSRDGVANLAPISFFTGVGRQPPVVSLSLQPLSDGVTLKHTFINIRDTGEFVTNLVTLMQADQMHHTAHEERAIVFVHYCWNAGVADAPERSAYAGPVLVVRGADDGLVTEDLVSASVSSRFASVTTVTVPRSGHWPHVEQPAEVAAQLDDFVANAIVPRSQVWRQAFASGTAEEFAEAFADDVVLEASVLHRPIEGRDRVKHVMAVASGIYDSLVFTHEANSGALTYVEWEATAFGGLRMNGVTILIRNESGQIVSARIHHRPLGAVLRFSAEMRERLRGAIDSSHFYGGPDAAR